MYIHRGSFGSRCIVRVWKGAERAGVLVQALCSNSSVCNIAEMLTHIRGRVTNTSYIYIHKYK